jgi:hypothetical protein
VWHKSIFVDKKDFLRSPGVVKLGKWKGIEYYRWGPSPFHGGYSLYIIKKNGTVWLDIYEDELTLFNALLEEVERNDTRKNPGSKI